MGIERGKKYVLVLKEWEKTGLFYAIAIYPVLKAGVEK
jgi:hypothetical protein